jgi:hypothetical protein
MNVNLLHLEDLNLSINKQYLVFNELNELLKIRFNKIYYLKSM